MIFFFVYTLAPSGPPLNIRCTSRSAFSLSFAWDPPEKTKQNGIIIAYTACLSHLENGFCFQNFSKSKRELFVEKLRPSTKYYIRVMASTKIGHGNYSESNMFYTDESKYNYTYKPSKIYRFSPYVSCTLADQSYPTIVTRTYTDRAGCVHRTLF